jgi:hypothetical protein
MRKTWSQMRAEIIAPFGSVAELMDHDERSPMPLEKFDDALWLLLTDAITEPGQARSLPTPVCHYLASRWLESEVGNGGFAQAAFNIPHWFQLAEEAYRALGKERSAELIREAMSLLNNEQEAIGEKSLRGAPVWKIFRHFEASSMAALDAKIVEREWYIDEERIAYVRQHRDAFREVGG